MVDVYAVDDSLDLPYTYKAKIRRGDESVGGGAGADGPASGQAAAAMLVVRLTIECHLRTATAPYCMCVMSSVRNPGL